MTSDPYIPNGPNPNPNSFSEYRRLILDKLDSTGRDLDTIKSDLATIKVEIAMLKVKSSIWGAVAGALITLGAVLLRLLG